ncbi:hypothetical protein, unknown function [Leishmania tarentolae]|uniref:Uncharacterized protein n=1 Tax=Leishmania tarentolae TaxID=5689 RepID=A0A640KFD9_LEITA|nr:hypothetical protein, unknown function [Leishmania tarentolae]GET88433.1 hypothetical protein, unknown function [Leishmania tarentolae]
MTTEDTSQANTADSGDYGAEPEDGKGAEFLENKSVGDREVAANKAHGADDCQITRGQLKLPAKFGGEEVESVRQRDTHAAEEAADKEVEAAELRDWVKSFLPALLDVARLREDGTSQLFQPPRK